MRAAFAVLAMAKPTTPRGRRIAALGDMLELGATAAEAHVDLAPAVLEHGIDLVFTAGPLMQGLHDALPPERRGAHAADSAALIDVLRAVLKPGDVLLVKGSLGSRMGRVVDNLLMPAPRAASGW